MGRRRTLDADEAGEMIGVSAATVYRLARDGSLPHLLQEQYP
jgi:predicted DNA-binding transcriptional regulator AlpA